MSRLWIEKYRPQTLDDLILNKYTLDRIKTWFSDFQNLKTKQNTLFFTGPPGVGKTSFAHIILEMHGYTVHEFNASDIRSKTVLQSQLDNIINNVNILSFFGDKRPVSIIIDEIDSMFKGDKGGFDELLKYITIPTNRKKIKKTTNNRRVPIICISNMGNNVKKEMIKTLERECMHIEFKMPTYDEILPLYTKIVTSEEMLDIFNNDDIKKFIIDCSQGDIRRLIYLLEYINIYEVENFDDVYKKLCMFIPKIKDVHITNSTTELFNRRLTYDECKILYYRDKNKLPMIMHENYISCTKDIDSAINALECICYSDKLEKHMFNAIQWNNMQNLHTLMCTYIPNYYLTQRQEQKYVEFKPRWTSMLSILSQSQNLLKNMHSTIYEIPYSGPLNIKDIQDILAKALWKISNDDLSGIDTLHKYGFIDYNVILNGTKKPLSYIDCYTKYIKLHPLYTKAKLKTSLNNTIEKYIKNTFVKLTTSTPVEKPTPKPYIRKKPRIVKKA